MPHTTRRTMFRATCQAEQARRSCRWMREVELASGRRAGPQRCGVLAQFLPVAFTSRAQASCQYRIVLGARRAIRCVRPKHPNEAARAVVVAREHSTTTSVWPPSGGGDVVAGPAPRCASMASAASRVRGPSTHTRASSPPAVGASRGCVASAQVQPATSRMLAAA